VNFVFLIVLDGIEVSNLEFIFDITEILKSSEFDYCHI